MGEIQKTDITKSPLLKPVIAREYTRGLDSGGIKGGEKPPDQGTDKTGTAGGPEPGSASGPGATEQKPNYNKPADDGTKAFSFDEPTENKSDLGEGETGPGVNIPMGSAKTFANFVGNAIQIYLPKATYGYVKIDMDNVIVNVDKGYLVGKWIDTFTTINKNTEEALKIPDESIKMWKAAFKDYLEYKQLAFANPETAFWAATALLIGDQGVRAYSIKKQNEDFMREALEESNPGLIIKKGGGQRPGENSETQKTVPNGEEKRA
jgi:hypothetical protein